MTPELWQRLKPLYEAALEMSAEARPRFIEDACLDDAVLREELENLLEWNTERTSPIDKPVFNASELFLNNDITVSVGQVLLGRFKIVRHLGSGGMGDVFEAQDMDLRMGRIALKVIRSSIAQNPVMLSRFKEEVLLARRVSGPNVCRIHELFIPSDQAKKGCPPFLTMEFVEGTTLSDRIATGGPISSQAASAIALQLCAALQSIHEAGVIHRDLKPRNIMLTPHNGADKVVVMDFGLAHAASHSTLSEEARNTIPGAIMGTPEYMAPEQFEGGEVSSATDIYALGLVLHELVTGKQLFAASSPFAAAVRRGRRAGSVTALRHDVPPVWDDVIAKCLEFDAERRFQSAAEVIVALHQHPLVIWRFRQGQRISLTRKSLIALGAALALAAAILGWFYFRSAFSYHMSPEVKAWYDRGTDDLNDGTYLKASKAFEMAIQLDPNYPLTHARLADAWFELDFTGQATEQMLYASAPDQQASLSQVEAWYVDAVRSKLVGDYASAIRNYQAILKRLPRDQKPNGLRDLGRTYEMAGRMAEAQKSYEDAISAKPHNPAPYVRLGVLKSRLRDPSGAREAFDRAEYLYRANSDQEGLDEVNFQRGYAANERGDLDEARGFLAKVMREGMQSDDVDSDEKVENAQLRVRTLSQLSDVEYGSTTNADKSNDRKAIEYANREKKLADERGLNYWSTDSLMRLGNAYTDEEDFHQAEKYLLKALELAHQNGHARLEAFVNFSLATLYDQQGRRQEQISRAQNALNYFGQFRCMNQADDMATLIIRAQEAEGNYAQALQSATELLQIAERADLKPYIEQAQETVGSVLMDQEQYPAALDHFQEAYKLSKQVRDKEAYQALHFANALWRLGRYPEAEQTLASIPAEARSRSDIASNIAITQAQIQLSQAQFRSALATSELALKTFTDMPDGKVADFEAVSAAAQAQLGHLPQALQESDKLLDLARKNKDESMTATAQLVYAGVALKARMPAKALSMAEAANLYFVSEDQKESEWLSFLALAEAAKASGDLESSRTNAKKAIDIRNELEHTWGSPSFGSYAKRPDRQLAIEESLKLANF